MIVVLDTNVIIAAFAARGLCTEVFEVCLAEHDVVLSEHILLEVSSVLSRKLRLPAETVQEITDYLRTVARVVEPMHVDEKTCRDKDDIKVLGTALAGQASCLITGDEDLLILNKNGNVKIISPREFWQILRR